MGSAYAGFQVISLTTNMCVPVVSQEPRHFIIALQFPALLNTTVLTDRLWTGICSALAAGGQVVTNCSMLFFFFWVTAFSNASFAYMWELAYTDASQQQVIFMNKYEVAKAELESVSEALKVARIGNGALKIHYCLPCYTDCTPAPTPPRPACHANPYWSWRKSL